MTTTQVCLKGRIREFGPRLERARDVVYVGRRCSMGGWRLPASPFANPYRVQDVGGAARAVALFREHLRRNPDLVQRARRELTGKRLACFCTSGPCHAAVLAQVCSVDGQGLAQVLGGPLLAVDGEAA